MPLESELEVAVKLVAALRGPIDTLRGIDKGLADYLRRSAHHLAVAINEARWHDGEAHTLLLRQASDNISEVYAALQLAEQWGHLDRSSLTAPRALLDLEQDLLAGPGERKLAG